MCHALTAWVQMWGLFAAEHGMIVLKLLIAGLIPDVPSDVREKLEWEAMIQR